MSHCGDAGQGNAGRNTPLESSSTRCGVGRLLRPPFPVLHSQTRFTHGLRVEREAIRSSCGCRSEQSRRANPIRGTDGKYPKWILIMGHRPLRRDEGHIARLRSFSAAPFRGTFGLEYFPSARKRALRAPPQGTHSPAQTIAALGPSHVL